MAKVFGPLESGERFAEAVQSFAQAVADRFGERHGRVEVSVAVKGRRRPHRSRKLSKGGVNFPTNGGSALLPILSAQPLPQDCGGCADMHYGIAKFIAENGGTDEETARACGVSLTIVRQAKIRHMLMLGDSPGNGRHGH